MTLDLRLRFLLMAVLLWCSAGTTFGEEAPVVLAPRWASVTGVSKSVATIQVCPEPPMRRGNKLHDPIYKAIADLNADYVRLQPWTPYPKFSVPELEPPANGETHWDFTLMDAITEDFMAATHGRPVVATFSVIPLWMYEARSPVMLPADPDQIDWAYDNKPDPVLHDSTIKLYAEYQARIASWYLNGGFTDELGVRHESGHHYTTIAYWEPLNEPSFTAEETVKIYDAVVTAVRKVAPNMKFAGPAFEDVIGHGGVTGHPDDVAYFLDPKNHQPGIPVDMLTYHWYSQPDSDEPDEVMQFTLFGRADRLITTASYIDTLRKRLSPNTLTGINELGSILSAPTAPQLFRPIPASYWNASGAMWAYLFGNLVHTGVNVLGAAEIIDYPGQFAAASLIDWETGQPNARFWVVRLLRENFGPGDKIVAALPQIDVFKPGPWVRVYAQGFVSAQSERKLLIVNKRAIPVAVSVVGAKGGSVQIVDQATTAMPVKQTLAEPVLTLSGFAVAVIALPAATGALSSDSTVAELSSNARAKAALGKIFPEILSSPQFKGIRDQSLRAIQAYAPEYFTEKKLQALDEALANLPKK